MVEGESARATNDNSAPPRRSSRRLPALTRRMRHTGIAVLLVAAFGSGVLVDRVVWDGGAPAGASSSFTDLPEFQVLAETWDLVHDEYVETTAIDDSEMIYGAARGMVESLGDTGHSSFFDPEEAEQLDRMTEGKFVGIGVQLDFTTGRPVIIAPIDNSPAAAAGIESDDVLLEINGESTERMSAQDVAQRLRGDEGTDVTLTLQHAESTESYTVTITRSVIEIEPVSWGMLPDRVALIRLSEFSVGATDGVEDALVAAKAQGATAIVLDLRDNPGGLVFEAIGVASQFMEEGHTIYLHKERDGEPKPVKTLGDGEGRGLPMVVLINGGSASAAEIVAGSLRDNGRAELIGETTFGTGTILTPFKLDDGSALLLGTGLWLTPEGEQIWHIGVEPDLDVDLPAGADEIRPADDDRVTRAELAASSDVQMRTAHGKVIAAIAASED